MTSEADTSVCDPSVFYNIRNSHQLHYDAQQHHMSHHNHISSSSYPSGHDDRHHPHKFQPSDARRSTDDDDDEDNEDNDKLISVDDFDDSDNEDIRSCSTLSPTPSDNAVNSSSSRTYGTGRTSGGCGKLRKKSGMVSKVMDEQELQNLRLKINSRERKRMHDLNSALDGLREVMPYAHGPSVRKLSKIATLLLAKNYILMLNSSLDEMKKLVSEIYHNHGPTRPGGLPPVAPPLPPPPQPTPVAVVVSSVASSMSSSSPNDTMSRSLSSRAQTPTSKPSDSHASVPRPQHHTSLSFGQALTNPMLSLPIPALRLPVPGLTPHEINAIATAYSISKAEGAGGAHLANSYSSHDRAHPYQRWPVPCACAQCLTGTGHLSLGLHLSRFSHPLLSSAPSLPRKN